MLNLAGTGSTDNRTKKIERQETWRSSLADQGVFAPPALSNFYLYLSNEDTAGLFSDGVRSSAVRWSARVLRLGQWSARVAIVV